MKVAWGVLSTRVVPKWRYLHLGRYESGVEAAIFLTAAYGPGPAGARARQPGAHWRCDETNDTFGHQTGVPHVTRGHAGPMTELLLRTVGFRDSSIARVALSDGPMLKGGER